MEMDFHTLSRRELQALCKKNKIPANMTNVAMADALAALHQVEGLEELLNPTELDSEKLVGKDPCGTPDVARTATRMSTRRKPSKEQQEPESSMTSSRTSRRTRKMPSEKAVQDCGGVNLLETPATPATRRKGQAASARQKAKIVHQEGEKDEGNKKLPEDSVMESRLKKPPVQKVYSTRRSVRLLEKTMADLTLADKKTIEPIKMDELDMETAAKEVKEEAEDIKNAAEVHGLTVTAQGWEKIDNGALLDQNPRGDPENEAEVEDGTKEENAETDNYSKVSAGVEPVLLGSDAKYNDHEADQMVDNIIETAINLESGCVVQMGDNPVIEFLEENIPVDAKNQLLAPSNTSATEISEESSLKVEKQLGVFSSTSATEDSKDVMHSEEPVEDQKLDEILSKSQEVVDEAVPQNVLEVPSLPEDQVDSFQQLEREKEHPISKSSIDLVCEVDQLVPESAGLVSVDEMGSEESAADKLEMQVNQSGDKGTIFTDELMMDPSLIEVPVTQTLECANEAPISVSLTEVEEFASIDPEPILSLAKTHEKIQVCADSEVVSHGSIMEQVEFAGETDGFPQSFNTKTVTSSTSRTYASSPLLEGKSSSKNQSPLEKMANILDENKGNLDSRTMGAEPDLEKAKKIDTNVQVSMSTTPLNDKSLRQLNKMLKEKLQIANKKSDGVSKQEQQSGRIRQALQELPDNCMAGGRQERID